jgi:hypothetical protein
MSPPEDGDQEVFLTDYFSIKENTMGSLAPLSVEIPISISFPPTLFPTITAGFPFSFFFPSSARDWNCENAGLSAADGAGERSRWRICILAEREQSAEFEF